MLRRMTLVLLCLAMGSAFAADVPAARISAEDFGALPFLSGPKLSPDGTKVLARVFVNGQRRLLVLGLGGASKSASQTYSMPDSRDLLWYRWAGDNRVLFGFGGAIRSQGEDMYSSRLAMIDLPTGKISTIARKESGLDGDTVIYVDRDGRSLLMSLQKTIYEYPSVWRVNLDTLEMSAVVHQHDHVWDWYADSSGVVRAGIGAQGKRWWLLYRKESTGKFVKALNKEFESSDKGDVERFIPIDGTDKGYAVANSRNGRYGLYNYDFANETLGEAIFEHPSVDIDDFYQSVQGGITAVFYTDDRSRVAWLDPKMKKIQEEIDAAIPNRINRVISIDREGDKMLVWTGSGSDPGTIYYYEPAAGAMKRLAKPYERLAGKPLATVEVASYRARDGLDIPAYLTVPTGAEPKSLPLIVMPHGGPFVRDEWGYDSWAQFLANRGYLVLQPNFRGSTGYGKAFVEKGMGQWGRAMQDDVDDGVKWLVDSGRVDPKRVCIMGASYGGYAAMWAAARNPEIYRCAISFAGISDVKQMLRYDRKSFSAPRYFRSWQEKVQGSDEFDLGLVSPLKMVDKFSIPILIAHGSKDENVPPSQSVKLHDALTKAGKPHEFVLYKDEEHGFSNPQNAVDFLQRVDAFLGANNPAGSVSH
ncbi:MAG: S9 family peptidase [Steroidobacteraceae bacterium]